MNIHPSWSDMNIGAIRLGAIIDARGLTIEAAVARLGLPPASGTLNRILSGKRLPTLKQAAKIEAEFGVASSDFTKTCKVETAS